MKKHALVIGYGASGKAALDLLETQGYEVKVYDDNPLDPSVSQVSIQKLTDYTFELAILSPGIHPKHPVCLAIKQLNIPIKGEAEYALSFLKQRKIGITGTNGKTTVTYLCEHILNYAGYRAIACGNVSKEKALSKIALSDVGDAILCVELSSFQLETLESPRFISGIILNITPDHLDRYDGMLEYAQSKYRLKNLSDAFYVFKDIANEFPSLLASDDIEYFIGIEDQFLGINFDSYIDKLNCYSAYLLLKDFNISDQVFAEAFISFKKPSHRLQKVHTISGVEFINDSKATNVDATIQALRSLQKPLILLAGGVDKGYPYSVWIPYLSKVKKVVCFGAAKEKIFNELNSHIACILTETLEEATQMAYDEAQDGDVVLLSPGCSSFDQFKDYQDRGEKFCQNVHNLKPKELFL